MGIAQVDDMEKGGQPARLLMTNGWRPMGSSCVVVGGALAQPTADAIWGHSQPAAPLSSAVPQHGRGRRNGWRVHIWHHFERSPCGQTAWAHPCTCESMVDVTCGARRMASVRGMAPGYYCSWHSTTTLVASFDSCSASRHHLPMQKRANIAPNTSSGVVMPIRSPSASTAARRSSASRASSGSSRSSRASRASPWASSRC